MSSIVTFYSYKGGVGRSMALANIAVLLARRGLKVLAVDWDLEAPGLERYFGYFEIKPGGTGLLRMCMEARDKGTADFRKFTSSFDCEAKHPIILLASGRAQDEAYTRNLEAFDWVEFFSKSGGQFVERLRHQWREEFDIVLIDSRTGLSDTGGICTIQLPDIVVAMFTANYQSLYGVRDVMRLAQKARQGLAYDRMPLSVLPLPTRWGIQEFQETQVWLDRVTDAVKEFCEDWVPRTIRTRDVIERIKVPQVDFFGFGEKLAVAEQGTTDPQGMGFVYDKIAAFLASDFTDLSALVGEQALREANRSDASTTSPAIKPLESADYLYDIFVSYDHSLSEWVLEFMEALKRELASLRADEPKIFMDLGEIRAGDSWEEQLLEALTRSRLLVAFLTPHYLASSVARREFLTFSKRALQTGKRLLVPVVLRGDDFPNFVMRFQWTDFRKLSIQKKSPSRHPAAWQREIMRLADNLNGMIDEAPPYDPHWTLASDLEVSDPDRVDFPRMLREEAQIAGDRQATEERRALEKAEAIRLAKEQEEAARVSREREATLDRLVEIGVKILLYVLMFGWLFFIAFSVVHHDFDWRSTESIIVWVFRRWYIHLFGSISMIMLIRWRADPIGLRFPR
jgi:MinD-like ATPase involved in chromosome partitioning or flagellar assembly